MSNNFPFSIITPRGIEYREAEATRLLANGIEGELAILPGHISFLTPLRISEVVVENSQGKKNWAVAGGMLQINREGARILTPAAEEEYRIDVERAKRAADRARKRLSDSDQGIDRSRAVRALRRAEVRLKVSVFHRDQAD